MLFRLLSRRRGLIAAWATAALLVGRPLLAESTATPGAATPAGPLAPAANGAALDARLDGLVDQLGSPKFAVRRSAANEIRKIGPEAFDRLQLATESGDPEIAASASYLLRQIAVRWTQNDDSAAVKRLLRGYGERDDLKRQRTIHELAALPQGEGVAALCRVARFDQTPVLARLAALSIIQMAADETGTKRANPPIDAKVFDRELGESSRVPVLWLRQFQLQLRDPAAAVAGWQKLIDEETQRLDTEVEETRPTMVSALLWNLADVYRQLGATEPLVEVADRMLAIGGADGEKLLGTFLNWLVQHEAWDALAKFSAAHQAEIDKSKQNLYLLAMANTKQGKPAAAEELARQAAKLTEGDRFAGLEAGQLLVSRGLFDWAVREYQAAIDGQPVESTTAIAARVELASLLQDYERYQAAAEVLAPLTTAMDESPDIARQYSSAQQDLAEQRLSSLPDANGLKARLHYLRAGHFEQQRDFAHQREALLAAIEADETDADVLIAMYRLADADDAWRADTRARIQKLSQQVEADIDETPNNPIPYNQWAWLIANTEGDFAKAVRLSRRSLELEPGMASFLDTLGRCYYAAGDYEKAVESQREAVKLIPHMQVMQRQLKQFEQALAAKQPAAAPAPAEAK